MKFHTGVDNEKFSKVAKSDACYFMPKLNPAGEESSLQVADGDEMNSTKPVSTQNIHPSLDLAMLHSGVLIVNGKCKI